MARESLESGARFFRQARVFGKIRYGQYAQISKKILTKVCSVQRLILLSRDDIFFVVFLLLWKLQLGVALILYTKTNHDCNAGLTELSTSFCLLRRQAFFVLVQVKYFCGF